MARFSRRARLLRAADFQRILKQGARVSTRYFTAAVHAGADPDVPRLGLALSARALPRAVDRNRVKRNVRETFRNVVPPLPVVDIVVLARTDCVRADARALRGDLALLWQRITVQCTPS